MKKRVLAVLLCLVMLGAAGCGGNSAKEKDGEAKSGTEENGGQEEQEETASEGEEYVTWIKEAWKEYEASEIRGFVESKFEGTQKEVNTVDTAKQQWMTLSYDGGSEEPRYTYYRTKEGDNDYTFKMQRTGEDTYEYLKVQLDPSVGYEESYSGFIKEEVLPLESNDETEVVSVSAVQEGEEDINGVQAMKIEVTYETKLKSAEKITKESVMSEHGWTEEEFAAMSDFHLNELVEAYVGIVNSIKEGRMEEPRTNHLTYYLSSEGHKLLRKVEMIPEASDYPKRAIEEIASLMRDLKTNLEYNTLEEAVQWEKELKGEYWDYEGLIQSMTDEITSSSALEVTTDYQTGEECQPIELPAEAKEITWEQYNNHEY